MFKSWLAAAALASAAWVLAESGIAQVVKEPDRDIVRRNRGEVTFCRPRWRPIRRWEECIGDSVYRCMMLRDLRCQRGTKRSCTRAGRACRGRGGGL
jgi:hypothetical protein